MVSRITASAAIATMATNVCGAFRSVSTAKKASTTAVAAIPTSTIKPSAPVSDAQAVAGDPDEEEDHQRAGAPDRGDRREVDEVGDGEDDAAVISSPAFLPSGEPRPKKGGNWPTSASIAVNPPEA